MTNEEKRIFGENYIRNYLQRKGYKIIATKVNGCDIVAEKDKKRMMVEVKTSSKKMGISDMHHTEFYLKDGKWYFVADFLYVLRINEDDQPYQLDILSREEIDRYCDSHVQLTKIRTTKLKRDLFAGKVGITMTPEKAWRKDRGLVI